MRTLRLFIAFFLLSLMASVQAEARVCGAHFLKEYRERQTLPAPKLLVPHQESGEIEVGTRLNFLVFNRVFAAAATCRYVGEHCYIFVEDSQWDFVVLQPDVDALGALSMRVLSSSGVLTSVGGGGSCLSRRITFRARLPKLGRIQ